jgi:hypothetical protein
MKEYYKDNTATVYYDAELDTLFLEYLSKVQNDEQFIRINTAVLNAFTQLNTIKFVADIRKMGIISINSQKFVVDILLPGMITHLKEKRLFHAQLLDPSEVFSKVSASNIKNKSSQVAEGFDVMQFTDANEMKAYLKEMK